MKKCKNINKLIIDGTLKKRAVTINRNVGIRNIQVDNDSRDADIMRYRDSISYDRIK